MFRAGLQALRTTAFQRGVLSSSRVSTQTRWIHESIIKNKNVSLLPQPPCTKKPILSSSNSFSSRRISPQALFSSFSSPAFGLFTSHRLRSLQAKAAKNPSDLIVQLQYIRTLNRDDPRAVVRHCEKLFRTGVPLSREIGVEHIKALGKLNRLDSATTSILYSRYKLGDVYIPGNESGMSQASASLPGMHQGNVSHVASSYPNHAGDSLYPGIDQSLPLHVQVKQERQWWAAFWRSLPSLLMVGVLMYGLYALTSPSRDENGNAEKRDGGMSFPFLKIQNIHRKVEGSHVTFDDVKGVDDAKEQLMEVVDFLRFPEKYQEIGAKMPRGVLLVGSPGTGKTLLARAVAGEAGCSFYHCSGSEFDEIFVGVGSGRVRKLFADARRTAPSIIFIDEIDTVGQKRQGDAMGNKSHTINQLLTEMDGFDQADSVVVLAATNLPDVLDKALTRPGRFDKMVNVPLPDIRGRKDILELYLKKTHLDSSVDIEYLARTTTGMTGAQLANIVNRAAIRCAARGMKKIDMQALDNAFDDVVMGIERKSTIIPEHDRKNTAYHEGGHALVALLTRGAEPIRKATILPRGPALGFVAQVAETDRYSMSREQMMARLAVAMGGRAAEQLIFGDDAVTSGASSDLQGATRLATAMVREWGMSERVGNQSLPVPGQFESPTISAKTQELIDEEVALLLKSRYEYAMKLLKSHQRELHNLANALLEHETLDLDQIQAAIQGKPIPVSKGKMVDLPEEPSSGSSSDSGVSKENQKEDDDNEDEDETLRDEDDDDANPDKKSKPIFSLSDVSKSK